MRHSRMYVPVLGLSLVMALAVVGCSDPTKNKPAATVSETSGEASTAPPAEGKVYTLTQDTAIGFVGSKVTGSHDGGFREFSGTVTVPGEELTDAHIDATIDMDSIYSDNERLTGHLKSPDFFDVPNHPEASFTSTAITKDGEGYTIEGDFTLHGVTKRISFPATISLSGDTLTADAEFSINRMDFGVVYPGKPDDLIREGVLIKLHIVAKATG